MGAFRCRFSACLRKKGKKRHAWACGGGGGNGLVYDTVVNLKGPFSRDRWRRWQQSLEGWKLRGGYGGEVREVERILRLVCLGRGRLGRGMAAAVFRESN